MPLIWTVNTMVYGIANKVITNAGICAWTLKAFGTTLLSNSLESRDYHLEAIFSSAPRICDIFQCDVVGLRKYDSILTHAVAGLVATDTFLQTYSWLVTKNIFFEKNHMTYLISPWFLHRLSEGHLFASLFLLILFEFRSTYILII